MTLPLLLVMPGNEKMGAHLAHKLKCEMAEVKVERFPDEEAHVTIAANPKGRHVAIVCTLDRPDSKFLPMQFASDAARDLGAVGVGLVAPYLAYMRQDRRFFPGEAVSSTSFARVVSHAFDWLVTVDPHLHRIAALSEIYTIETKIVHAASALARWIVDNIQAPLLIGPDSESRQWIAETAASIGARFTVLEKRRTGPKSVEISLSDPKSIEGGTPVLIDDIVSTGRTLMESIKLIRTRTGTVPVCIAVHALFSGDAYAALSAQARVVTTNTVPHSTNAIDLSCELAAALRDLMMSV